MKIAVTSTGKTLDLQVDPRFGRAACFIIIDTETMHFSVIDNENVTAAGGAGISSAKAVIDAGAQAVLTGNCGPNAERTLNAASIKLYTGLTGTVTQAVELFKSGGLTEASGPNVQSHFRTGTDMKIAVASGKGGTGKTTIATNLACSIVRTGRKVQYLDCDVEEPNGHIFLKPDIEKTQAVMVDVPQVDLKKCTGCGKCGWICQYGAIVHLKDNNVLTFEQLCHSCGGCLRICPADAIKPKPLNIGDVELGKSGDINFVHGKLCIGNVRTVSLIKEVKRHIEEDCLSILDVPPGTSCPVVEAVKGVDYVLLVTEPTPFGLNDLKLAVGLVRQMNLPFAVIINRHGIGNEEVEEYCKAENIEIALKLPDDRRIAEAYSSGQTVIEALPEYKGFFVNLAQTIKVLE